MTDTMLETDTTESTIDTDRLTSALSGLDMLAPGSLEDCYWWSNDIGETRTN